VCAMMNSRCDSDSSKPVVRHFNSRIQFYGRCSCGAEVTRGVGLGRRQAANKENFESAKFSIGFVAFVNIRNLVFSRWKLVSSGSRCWCISMEEWWVLVLETVRCYVVFPSISI
jgi:hypothetical protein